MKIEEFNSGDSHSLSKLFYETIREVNSADYNKEQVEAWAPDHIDKEKWLKSFEGKIVLVAKECGNPVGFCELRKDGYIDRFYVKKDRIGGGIGKELYQELEKKAFEMKLVKLFVDASITAKVFFEKMGFKVLREQVGF